MISSEQPVLSLEDELYIFSLGTDDMQWNNIKKKYR